MKTFQKIIEWLFFETSYSSNSKITKEAIEGDLRRGHRTGLRSNKTLSHHYIVVSHNSGDQKFGLGESRQYFKPGHVRSSK